MLSGCSDSSKTSAHEHVAQVVSVGICAKGFKFIKSDVYIEADLDFVHRFYLRCRPVSLDYVLGL